MAGDFSFTDANQLSFKENESLDDKFKKITNWMYLMNENWRFAYYSLEIDDLDAQSVQNFTNTITEPIYAAITDVEGNVSTLSIDSKKLQIRLENAEGSIATLNATALGLGFEVKNPNGKAYLHLYNTSNSINDAFYLALGVSTDSASAGLKLIASSSAESGEEYVSLALTAGNGGLRITSNSTPLGTTTMLDLGVVGSGSNAGYLRITSMGSAVGNAMYLSLGVDTASTHGGLEIIAGSRASTAEAIGESISLKLTASTNAGEAGLYISGDGTQLGGTTSLYLGVDTKAGSSGGLRILAGSTGSEGKALGSTMALTLGVKKSSGTMAGLSILAGSEGDVLGDTVQLQLGIADATTGFSGGLKITSGSTDLGGAMELTLGITTAGGSTAGLAITSGRNTVGDVVALDLAISTAAGQCGLSLKSGQTELGSMVYLKLGVSSASGNEGALTIEAVDTPVGNAIQLTMGVKSKNGSVIMGMFAGDDIVGEPVQFGLTVQNKNGFSTLGLTANGAVLATSGNITFDTLGTLTLRAGTSGQKSMIYLDRNNSEISSAELKIAGMVTFADLANANGTTTINGSNITTGEINADLITAGTINANLIKSGTLRGRDIILSYDDVYSEINGQIIFYFHVFDINNQIYLDKYAGGLKFERDSSHRYTISLFSNIITVNNNEYRANIDISSNYNISMYSAHNMKFRSMNNIKMSSDSSFIVEVLYENCFTIRVNDCDWDFYGNRIELDGKTVVSV